VAALSCGIASKRYAYTHMAAPARRLSKSVFLLLAELFDAVVYFLVGASCAVYAPNVHAGLLLGTLFGCVAARALSLCVLSGEIDINTRTIITIRLAT
jgi:NhaP-type Na+/H+ or K+/H+ antiporter